jgi:ribosomal protein L7/L12
MHLTRIAVAVLVTSWLTPPALAANGEPGQQEFVSALVTAINAQDLNGRRGLVHSGTRHCAQDAATDDREAALRRRSSTSIPDDYRWAAIALPADVPLMFADRVDYPVRPTHVLEIFYQRNPHQISSLVVQIARDGADWREVVPCVKPAALAEMRAARAARDKQMERVEALLAQMRPELRDEILKMVRDGRKVDAIKHYRSAVGEDLSMAKYVVDRLAETVVVQ